ncbi:MAG: M48 family metalloprotease [Phycisphaerae bacterium]|nr:M48 family metalloprotease [Phycisphaerae bacterium]
MSGTRGLCVLVAAALGLMTGGCAVNPLTGAEEPLFMSVEEERALGARIAPEVEAALRGPIPNEALQRYIDRVGQRVACFSDHPDWEYSYRVVEHTMVNAFALPGGTVYITRGLLEKLTSEAELAGILAHETVHVVARDTAVALSKQKLLNAGLLAAAVGAASGEVDPRVFSAAQLTGQVLMLRYSRQDEREADLGGLDYMTTAGYDPNGMVRTMQMLHDLNRIQPVEFLSTHPSHENRIAYLKQAIASARPGSGLRIGKEDYQTKVLDFLKTHPKPRGLQEF